MPIHYIRDRARAVIQKTAALTFRSRLPRHLWDEQRAWLATAKGLSNQPLPPDNAAGTVYALSQSLRAKALDASRGRYANRTDLRVLIHVPPARISMAGNSIFSNWIDGLQYMGVACEIVETGKPVNDYIERFQPTIFFTSDHASFLQWIDWERLRAQRARYPMTLGMTASAEHDGNTSVRPRLQLARKRGVNFYVSFRESEYIAEHLSEFTREGYPVLSIPFSVNPIKQFNVPFAPKPLDYVFLASINPEKAMRYWAYFAGLLPNYRGVINGPGWGQDNLISPRLAHPYIYALGAIGVNLHIPSSIRILSEVNERTFILAGTGTFQLCDSPQVLRRFFSAGAVPSAESPSDYAEMFTHFQKNPEKRVSFQLESLKTVYAGHTIFDRMTTFLDGAIGASRSPR